MHRIMSHDMHEIPLTNRGFEGVCTERKVGPPKAPQTSGVWGQVRVSEMPLPAFSAGHFQ